MNDDVKKTAVQTVIGLTALLNLLEEKGILTEEEYEKLLPDIVKSYQDIRGMDECWTNDRDIAIEEVIRRYKNAD